MGGAGGGALLDLAGPVVLSLAVMLGFAVAAGYLARRFKLGAAAGRGVGAGRIVVVATRPLGLGCSVMIVEADGQRFVVGVGRQGLTSLGALAPVTERAG